MYHNVSRRIGQKDSVPSSPLRDLKEAKIVSRRLEGFKGRRSGSFTLSV